MENIIENLAWKHYSCLKMEVQSAQHYSQKPNTTFKLAISNWYNLEYVQPKLKIPIDKNWVLIKNNVL